VFVNNVVGGGGNVLELASAASTGTLSGLGSKYKNFGTVTVDSGANWVHGGSNTFASGGTLTDGGTLTVGYLDNDGDITGSGKLVVDPGTMINSGSVGIAVTLSGAGNYLSNTSTAVISVGGNAVYGTGGAVSVTNAGAIEGTGTLVDGILLLEGGSVDNTGTISGGTNGIVITDATGTVTNSGTITGGLEGGVYLNGGGSVANNGTAAYISGYNVGVEIRGAVGTVANSGTMDSKNGLGVVLNLGGSIANTGTAALIEGEGNGVLAQGAAATVTNAGTIEGMGTAGIGAGFAGNYNDTLTNSGTISGRFDSVLFSGSDSDRVIIDPGAVFVGNVIGGSGSNTLELASATSTGTGTIGGLGSKYQKFGDIIVDPGASWDFASGDTIGNGGTLEIGAGATVTGTIAFGGVNGEIKIDGTSLPTDPTLAIGATIGGMVRGDVIDLTGIAYNTTNSAVLSGSDVLKVTENGQTYDLQLAGNFTGNTFNLAPDGSGTLIEEDNTPCYCRGTLILTDRGEVPVEELAIGDLVMTVSGEAKPIKWIGMRSYDGRFIRGQRDVLPVVITAGALGEGIPARDLWVSPEHALYIDKLLVPAKLLVNGMTITQVAAVERLEYFHIELDPHDVIFAEGTPAETYIECDNRLMFHNAAEYTALYPETAPCQPYAPRIAEGRAATTIRKRLLARAVMLGNEMTRDPGLHLIADGVAVPPLSVEAGAYRFTLKRAPKEAWLASRSAVPAETDPAATDRRRLGVCVRRIGLRDADFSFDLLPGNPHLGAGFHEHEGEHRWTDGLARLPAKVLALFPGALDIDIALSPSELRYAARAEIAGANVVAEACRPDPLGLTRRARRVCVCG
jgi:hypothetical protein